MYKQLNLQMLRFIHIHIYAFFLFIFSGGQKVAMTTTNYPMHTSDHTQTDHEHSGTHWNHPLATYQHIFNFRSSYKLSMDLNSKS